MKRQAFGLLLALAGAAACEGASVEELLAGKACAPDGACADGYRCVDKICVVGGTGGAPPTGSCESVTDCPEPANACETPVCLAGECGTVALEAGETVAAGDQIAGNCKTSKCDGAGHLLDENDDLDVPDDGRECTFDICVSGVPDHRVAAFGAACTEGDGSFCDAEGNCAQCVVASDCTALPPDDFCQQRACEAGSCKMIFTAAGTELPGQTAGDCQKLACDGSGQSSLVADPSDGPDDGNDCTADSCVGGAPDFDPLPAGTACQAGACNASGQCTGCTLATDCSGTDTFCRQRTCTGNVCGFDYTNAGTALPAADQNVGDCQSLTCNGAGAVQSVEANGDAPFDDGQQCTGQACVNGTPQFPPATLDTACNEGGGVVCNGAGDCVACNSPGQCGAQGSVCEEATCVANACGLAPKTAGTPAKAGAQTSGDCQIVLCDGSGQPSPSSADNGDIPVDSNACTNDVCTAGTPSHPPAMQGTPCGGGGQCNGSGACGTPKPDGDPCALGTECASGDCVDGFCCENACGSACNACSAAKTGGANGDCAPIPVGEDPDAECDPAQTCNGSGACAFTCGQEPSPPGGACPAICTGGCLDGTCIIACNTNNACKDDTLDCPAGFACTVECGANDACKNAIINCPSRYACNVACSVDCEGANINCSTGTCSLTCGAGMACKNADLGCGGNTCEATCNGTADLPAVACGSSCDCDACGLSNGQACTGPMQCQSGVCPPSDDVCCSSSCMGPCRSCLGAETGGASGTCGFIAAGTDPANECPGAQTCNGNGACQP
jgi:hypothetical protein